MTADKESEWQKLEWAKKVELCEQGRANENNLLQSHRFIFIALEAILFAVFFNTHLCSKGNITAAVLGIIVAGFFIYIFVRGGKAVDRWEKVLHDLWNEMGKHQLYPSEVEASEFVEQYKSSVERRKKGWVGISFGWGKPCWLKSWLESRRRWRLRPITGGNSI